MNNQVLSHKEYIREMMRRKKAAKMQEVNEYYEEESAEEEEEEGEEEEQEEVFHSTADRPTKRKARSNSSPELSEDEDDASPKERDSWV